MTTENQTFIKDESLLEEKPSELNFFDIEKNKENIKGIIDHSSKSVLVGFIGGFGEGKSTILKHIKKETSDKYKWINFEAWEFPERKELWEGFVIEVARQTNNEEKEKVLKKIEGKSYEGTNRKIDSIADAFKTATLGFSSLFSNVKSFFYESPAKRIFQIQYVLNKLIDKIEEEKIIIIAEDTDRSGPEGIYFIETLKHFIKEVYKGEKEIIVIIPISNVSYFENEESYLKSLDLIEIIDRNPIDLNDFSEHIFADHISKDDKLLLSEFFGILISKYPKTTIRKIKQILRRSLENFKKSTRDGIRLDWRIIILFETTKFFEREKGLTYFDFFRRANNLSENTVFESFICCCGIENIVGRRSIGWIRKGGVVYTILLEEGLDNTSPYYNQSRPRDRGEIILSKVYFNY